jgi:hypothetical protein
MMPATSFKKLLASVLKCLATGSIPDPEATPLEEHLSGCEQCAATLDGLQTDDTLSVSLRQGKLAIERFATEQVRTLCDTLARQPYFGGSTSTSGIERELAGAQAAIERIIHPRGQPWKGDR